MNSSVEVLIQVHNLMQRAREYVALGNRTKGLEFMDQAIAVADENNLLSFDFRLERESLIGKSDNRFIEILSDTLNYYQRQNNLIKQVDTLIELSKVANNDKKFNHLDDAEKLLLALQRSDLDALAHTSGLSRANLNTFFSFSLREIRRIRAFYKGKPAS